MWDKETPKRKRTFNPMVFLVWGMVIFVVSGIASGVWRLFASATNGSGNVLNYSYVTEFENEIYYVNSPDERLTRIRNGKAEVVSEGGAIYLTVIEDALYYVSTETGFFMRYIENGDDVVVLDYGCNNPIYKDGLLYFYSGMEALVYTVSVDEGVFGDPVCMHEDIGVVSFSLDNDYIYYIPAAGIGLWRWALNGSEPPQKLTDAFCGQPIAVDGEVYFQVMDDTEPGIHVIRKNGKEETLVNTPAGCLNIAGGRVYYTDLSDNAGGSIYSIRKNAKAAPNRVTMELGADLQIVSGYVYYRTNTPQGGMIWKRIPAGKTDKNAKTAEIIGEN